MQSLVCTFYFTLCIKRVLQNHASSTMNDRHRGWEYLEQRPSLLSCDLTGAEVLSCLLGLTGTLATPPFTSTDRLKKKRPHLFFFYWDWQAQRPRPHLLTPAGKRLVAIYMWPLCPSVPVKGHVADRYRSHAFFLCRTGRHSWGWREKEKWLWWSEQKEKSKTFLLVLNSSWHEADYFFSGTVLIVDGLLTMSTSC